MKPYLAIFILFLCSCHSRHDQRIGDFKSQTIEPDTVTNPVSKNSVKDSIELLEYFVDSLSIGRPKQNKIELVFLRSIDSSYVVINFYKRTQKDSWTLKQKFNFLKEDLMGCFTELADFNNDGFNDVTYKSLVAARGANDVRNLFIYDGITDQLIYMKNSEDYPNMLYNKKLNCIDAFLVHGGSTTVFLKIEKDSLKEFASVNLDDKINIRLVDKNGKRKYLVKDKKSDFDPHTRFTNFSPLE